MKAHVLNIGKHFSATPSGRYTPEQGEFTGERLREQFLLPLLREHEQVAVELDDTRGYSSPFLEEAFGGLVRHGHFTREALRERLLIVTEDEAYREEILDYINEAEPGDIQGGEIHGRD
ncbi:MAG: STAS-like domain-containing protein [Magnetococcales bacterium]|nr:STAS-like domain-containing protein [Magnetococcales bacterium]